MELTALKAHLRRSNCYRLATFELLDEPGFVVSASLWDARESKYHACIEYESTWSYLTGSQDGCWGRVVRRSSDLAKVVSALERTLHVPLANWPGKPIGLLRPHLVPQPTDVIVQGEQRLEQLFRARWLPPTRLESPVDFPDTPPVGSFQIVYAHQEGRYLPVRALPLDDTRVQLLEPCPDNEKPDWGYFAGDVVATVPHGFSPGEVHPVLTDVLAPGPRLPLLRLQAAATDL